MSYDGPPIYYAIRGGNIALALQRINAGADVDHHEPNDGNAVMWAAYKGNLDLLHVLIDRGANLNRIHEEWGKTALDMCSDARCYKLLLEHGAISATGKLHALSNYDISEVVERQPIEAIELLAESVRGVLRTPGEDVVHRLHEFLSAVESVLEQSQSKGAQAAVGEDDIFWANLDPIVSDLEMIGTTHVVSLLRTIRELLEPEAASFETLDFDRLYNIGSGDAAAVVKLLQQILAGREPLCRLLIEYVSSHRDLFEK